MANATFRAGYTVHIKGGTIIRAGSGGAVRIESGNINGNVRLARGDFISGRCNAQVSLKREATGTSELEAKDNKSWEPNVIIYPNPADEMVTIEKNSTKGEPLNYELLNYKGRIVKSGTVKQSYTSIKVKTLSAGIYLWKTHSENGQIQTRKMIVE